MCGIVAVLPVYRSGLVHDADELIETVGRIRARLDGVDLHSGTAVDLAAIASELDALDAGLRGPAGAEVLRSSARLEADLGELAIDVDEALAGLESGLEVKGPELGAAAVESTSAAMIELKDLTWSVSRDRVRTARAVDDFAGRGASAAAVTAYWSIQVALAALDRLEVRGRDSAGLHVMVSGNLPGSVLESAGRRSGGGRFEARSVEVAGGGLSFVYKAAAEIGELGDNTAALRAQVDDDELLRAAVSQDGCVVTVLGHTRWASVGVISEPNAHPLNSIEPGRTGPYCVAALNGDVDNFADLVVDHRLEIDDQVTTDAKVIPTLVSRAMDAGSGSPDAFTGTVASFEGSVAIAAQTADAPDELMLALRGSGQALYIGLANDAYVVASEPYGLVEEAGSYLRLDGETPANPDSPLASQGQVVVLTRTPTTSIAGVRRHGYDRTPLPVSPSELVSPEITTRDIDRGEFPHYLLKELTESPESFRKTLRGRLARADGRLRVALGESALPADLVADLGAGRIGRVSVIGQGTAAVAGQAVASELERLLVDTGIRVRAQAATELSGFEVDSDLSDLLVVAISQSGTTTDTNRTVDVVRARGARVVSIVNRRGSDLTDRSDGVLYTSDGRDVEMSVPSTKAFYAQVAAGFLLATAVAEAAGVELGPDHQALLEGLGRLPGAMNGVLGLRSRIADAARRHAPVHRYWAIVGNGPNRVAAEEVRIKLSELCYKSISRDITEDKKHIDLAAEPLIFVCAAGLTGSNADDVAKEIAIYRAHKAVPVVVGTEGDHRFDSATEFIGVPAVHPALDFVLSAMVGHIFGYEAALAIDAGARPMREMRAAIEELTGDAVETSELFDRIAPTLDLPAREFFDGLRAHTYDGHLEASTAVRLSMLLRYVTRVTPLESYELDFGRVGTPAVALDDLVSALTAGIDELTRPIDAIRHQAKTVTVGISRSDETLLASELVRAVLEAGAPRDALGYEVLRTLGGLDPAVAEVIGHTRYRFVGSVAGDETIVEVVDRGGVALGIPSRVSSDPRLRGTKRRAAEERRVTVALGRSDGRTVIHVPETKGGEATGLTLLHVRFVDRLAADSARAVLQSYRSRYAALRDAVTETEPTFRDDLLGSIDVTDLLTLGVNVLAERWRSS